MSLRARLSQFKTKVIENLDDYPALQAVPYWLAAILVGFVAVGYTNLFHLLSEVGRGLVEQYRYWTLLFLPFCLLLGWWVVWRFARLAVGSGIPQVMAALELSPDHYNEKVSALIGLKTVVVKIFSSFAYALGGAAVGPEGPAIQIAAGVFHAFGRRFQRIWPQIGHESLILAGGAAGVAAAFNTPLGGIVFAIEELSHHHFHKVKTALLSAVIIAGLVAQWINGPYLLLGYPPLRPTGSSFFLWAILIGLITGLLGAFFSKLVIWGANRFSLMSFGEKSLFNLWVGTSLIVYCCHFGTDSMGAGIPLISKLLFSTEAQVDWTVSLGRFVFPFLGYMAGGASGLLAPALAAGAVVGRQFNDLCHIEYPNLMVLLGMIGFLSAFTRAPFTAFVLVLEMTDRHSAIFFMMITSLVASAVSRSWGGKSLYENRKELYFSVATQAAMAPIPPPPAEPKAASSADGATSEEHTKPPE